MQIKGHFMDIVHFKAVFRGANLSIRDFKKLFKKVFRTASRLLDSGEFKAGFYLKAVYPPRDLGLMRISRSRFKQSKNCSLVP